MEIKILKMLYTVTSISRLVLHQPVPAKIAWVYLATKFPGQCTYTGERQVIQLFSESCTGWCVERLRLSAIKFPG